MKLWKLFLKLQQNLVIYNPCTIIFIFSTIFQNLTRMSKKLPLFFQKSHKSIIIAKGQSRNKMKINLSMGAQCQVQFIHLYPRKLKEEKFMSKKHKDNIKGLLVMCAAKKHQQNREEMHNLLLSLSQQQTRAICSNNIYTYSKDRVSRITLLLIRNN